VYVDNDPIVLVHARALLTSNAEGATAYLEGDLRQPEPILAGAAKTLDFEQPIAVLLIGVLHLIADAENPNEIINTLIAAVPSGSYLALTQPASDINAEVVAEGARRYNQHVSTKQTRRNHAETARFFDGLELVEPGLVQVHRWRPDPDAEGLDREVSAWGGIGRRR